MSLCERIAAMDRGKKVLEGRPEVVARDPKAIRAYLGGNMPLLEVIDLEAGHKRVPVLRGLSFRVKEGEIIAIVGSNGWTRPPSYGPFPDCSTPLPGKSSSKGRPFRAWNLAAWWSADRTGARGSVALWIPHRRSKPPGRLLRRGGAQEASGDLAGRVRAVSGVEVRIGIFRPGIFCPPSRPTEKRSCTDGLFRLPFAGMALALYSPGRPTNMDILDLFKGAVISVESGVARNRSGFTSETNISLW